MSSLAVPVSSFAQDADPADQVQGADSRIDVPPPPVDAGLPDVEPIVPDEEFEETVPELDEEADSAMDAPLETIEDFERRIAEDQAGVDATDGQSAPLGEEALADGDANEEIGDAPVRDSELTQPLPPIDDFNVEPVEFAEDAEDDAEVEVTYSTKVDGLASADKETETDLDGMFKGLSALRDGDGTAANTAQVSARLTEDSALLQRILASEGWYEAAVTTRIERGSGEDDQSLIAILNVVPGQRFSFSDITVNADPTVPADLIDQNFALKVGEPIVADRVQGAEAQLAVALPENGYPFVEINQRDILLNQYEGTGAYTLPVDTGPRSRYGGFRTTGDLAFDTDHIDTLARFEEGEIYDSREIDDLRQALVATGLFNTVSVSPQRTEKDAGDGTEYVEILVDQQAGPPRSIAGSAGYGTGQGFRVEASWTHRNMFPPEGALIVTGVGGTQEQGASVTFRRSNAGRRDRTFSTGIEALHSDYDSFEGYTGRVFALWSYDSTPIWQKRFTYAYGAQAIVTSEDDFNVATGRRERRTFYIGGLTGQVGFDTTNDLLDATEGFRLTALIEPEGSLQGDFSPYVRARLDGSTYYSVSDSLVVAGRVRLGTIQGIDRFDLAPSRRFYAGGGGSVRGFAYQKVGPLSVEPNPNYDATDPDETADPFVNRPIGGRSVNEAAIELRYRFGNFGVVGFVDAGQVYTDTIPDFSNLRYGAGIGGRFYTNFGPLRLDVATPLDRRDGESWINVYVSIGQAF